MTAFDFTSYPLDSKTGFQDALNVTRDIMDDGTMHVRVLGGSGYRSGSLVFKPMSESEVDSLLGYLHDNRATEFTFSGTGWGAQTYTGYIASEPSIRTIDGPLSQVTVDVYARRG